MKNTIFILSLLIAISCTEKPKEVVSGENQPYILASVSYCEKAEAALNAWAKGDFNTWATYFAEEVEFNYPRGPKDAAFNVQPNTVKKEAIWYRDWFKTREVTDVAFNPISSVAILATQDSPFYGNAGVSVLSIATMEISIYGVPIKAGSCYIHHFDEEGLIDKSYFIQDIQNQLDALNY